MTKRFFDFGTSLLGLLLLAPVFAVIGAAIKRDSEGPVFYQGDRIGRGAKPFKIIKFRTMDETPEAHNGPRITAQDDARITRLGRFLRDSKLNELPQLINVLKGEMSLVGPRPEDPQFVEHYTEEQREVLSVRPGITSLASVIFSDEEKRLTAEDLSEIYLQDILPDKLRLDLLYVRNRSFLLDLDILFRTLTILIPRFRKASLQAEDVFLGPFRYLRGMVSWFTIDAVIAGAAVAVTEVFWSLGESLNFDLQRALIAAFFIAAVLTVMNSLTGAQKVQWRYASTGEAGSVILSVLIATGLLLVANTRLPEPRLPPGLLLVAGSLALGGFLGVRYRRQLFAGFFSSTDRLHRPPATARERVLIVGSGQAGQLAIWLLQNSLGARVFHIVGVVDDDLEKIGKLIHRIPVIGRTIRIPDLVAEQDIDLILFAIHTIDLARRHDILQKCWKSGARTVVVPDVLSLLHSGKAHQAENGWLQPGEGSAQDHEPPLNDRELYQAIQLLAELARMGDYARVTEKLIQLDSQIVAWKGDGGKTESEEQGSRGGGI